MNLLNRVCVCVCVFVCVCVCVCVCTCLCVFTFGCVSFLYFIYFLKRPVRKTPRAPPPLDHIIGTCSLVLMWIPLIMPQCVQTVSHEGCHSLAAAISMHAASSPPRDGDGKSCVPVQT